MIGSILPRRRTLPRARCYGCGHVGRVLVFSKTLVQHLDRWTRKPCRDRSTYEVIVLGWKEWVKATLLQPDTAPAPQGG